MQDAAVPLLLTQESLAATLPPHRAKVICVDLDAAAVAPSGKSAGQPTAESLAYMIYTSGSTGRPKGALNTHRAIVNRLLWMQDEYRLTSEDAVLQKTPFSFDVSVWEFFWPLIAGARLVMAEPGGHRDAAYLVRMIEEQQITCIHFVPSMLRIFLEQPDLAQRCRSLRHVICSGEALPHELQERFFARLPCELHNLYGPTEAAVDVTYWKCRRGDSRHVVPIGKPVANTQTYILDEQLQPVGIGEEGELHLGGVQIGRGYHNRPDLTAEKFIRDPFSTEAGARLYKTGDLARWLSDGVIEFLGRIDHQVKLRGFRVELGEIESLLMQHAQVRQAVVVARGERLIGYIEASQRPPAEELRTFLSRSLPDYMVPSSYVFLDALPLSPNGKVDRHALPEPIRERPPLMAFTPPRGPLESWIAQLWSETLELDRVGAHDKFFELGGTSLQAAAIINRVQERLGEFIYIIALFNAPTVAEFATLLRKDYAAAVARSFPGESVAAPTPAAPQRIDAAMLDRLRSVVPLLQSQPAAAAPKNPRAIFILAPPRSGTTLLRVMLAGHPDLFAAAELQLLTFRTLAERRAAFAGKYSLWLEGALRAIMEVRGCDAAEAARLMDELEARDLTTREFYRELQSWIAPRTLVDKSPQYALDPGALAKAEQDFEAPLYIHLVRHPYAMVRSFENYHMDQVLFLREQPFTARQLGELVWTASHQNINTFLKTVPEERQFRLRFEDLVTSPEPQMRALCERLGLSFHPELLQPYENTRAKMVDGLHAESIPMGDTHFREHGRINPQLAEAAKQVASDNFLGEITWQIAAEFGYENPAAPAPATLPSRRDLMQRQQSRRREHRAIV
jgi:amino acid adenylation domain-containing protein